MNAALACNLKPNDKAPKEGFYSNFTTEMKAHIVKIDTSYEKLLNDTYDFTSQEFKICNDILIELKKDHPIVLPLFIASRAAGIYKCENNCTYRLISNKYLLFQYISGILLQKDMQIRLQNLCKDQRCEDAIKDIENEDFSKQSFEKQKSTLSIIIENLMKDIDEKYEALSDQIKEDCEAELKARCNSSYSE